MPHTKKKLYRESMTDPDYYWILRMKTEEPKLQTCEQKIKMKSLKSEAGNQIGFSQ